jgi:2-dehydro-3-deoxyphosphogluconate aldolase/(4S)-4-hydroxy-2-oxoglutarate aldolase
MPTVTAAPPELEALEHVRVVPIVTVDRSVDAPYIVTALVAGGLPVVEITLRTPAGIEGLRTSSGLGAVLGAGTVTTADDAARVIDAGARFAVSPGIAVDMVTTLLAAGVPVYPGVATPSEVMIARSLGLRTVKVFPAGALGGPAFVRSLSGVWPDMRFMPTGGITETTMTDYLAIPAVLAVGGTWIVPQRLVEEQDWPGITELARRASDLSRESG